MERKWLEDPYAQEWINGVKTTTKKTYVSEFGKWQNFIQMSPSQQIKERILDLQSDNPKVRGRFEDKVKEYKIMLETQGYKGKTVHNKLTAVQSFFSAHRVRLQFRRGELKPRASDEEKIINKFVPSNVEIRAMHNLANVRDRALLLVLYHSGFSPIDALSLNIEHIKNIYELEDNYYIQLSREKTTSIQATCISIEAIREIQSMLKSRGKPTEGALFVTPRGERLTTRFLNDAMKKLAKQALPEERAEQFITKSLRDAYNCALLQGDLMQEIKDLMFGHKRAGAKSSYAYNETIIRTAYEKVGRFLSINGRRQNKKTLEKIENSLIGLSETVTKQQEKIKELENQLGQERNDRGKDTLKIMKTITELIKKQNPDADVKYEEFDEKEN